LRLRAEAIDSSRYCRRARKSPAPASRRPSSAIIGKDSVGTVGGATKTGVLVGVLTGVFVGVFVGVLVGVFVGVLVGVFVGVLVGVFVGVGVHARICGEFVVEAETGPESVPVAAI
jgi:ABC-type microcin C transport system permease subunit YejE